MSTASICLRDHKVFANLKEFGKQSLRKIAEATGLGKDSVHRAYKALKKRNQHPESEFWETEAGQAWLRRLILSTIYEFGIKSHHGAEKLSTFFKQLRIDQHKGVSESTIQRLLKQAEEELVNYQQLHEGQLDPEKLQEIVASGDETFFNDTPILVLMELSSGYIIVEEESQDRSYDSWFSRAENRLKQLGLKVRHFVSDRGKSLVKLALDGFNCCAGADLFHAQRDISKWLGQAFYQRLGKATRCLKTSREKLNKFKEKGADKKIIDAQKQIVKQDEAALYEIEQEQQAYKESQQAVSESVHAFDLEGAKQTSVQVEDKLHEQAQRFDEIAKTSSISDSKGKLTKFKKQIEDVACTVDFWWLWAIESLVGYGLGADQQDWLLYSLLPVIYWYQQEQKTDNSKLKKVYQKAYLHALKAWQRHPLTLATPLSEINQWQTWAEWIVGKFQRTSSAVEGRNGCLSQMYHTGRGLTAKRLRALTVIHNFGIKRRDGTTAAERLFDTQFPDLLEWLIDHMGELPMPRVAKSSSAPNPLNLQSVAA